MSLLALTSLCLMAAADEPEPPPPPDDARASAVVVVEGAALNEATDPQATSASVTVIEVDDSLPASSDVSTVVDSASGTTVQRLGGLGDWSTVSIRGSTTRQVLVVLDGIPLNPDGASAVNLSELPLWAFSRVEIFRGNAPPELGAAPVGGVVHLRTGERTAGGAASVSYGSLDTARLTAMTSVPGTVAGTPVDALAVAELFGTAGDFTWFSDNGTEYNRLDDSLRTRENNDKRQLNSHVRLRLGEPGARLSLLQSFLSRDEGLPGHGANPTDDVRLRTQRSLTALSGDRSAGLWRIEGRGWLIVRDDTFDDRAGELGVGVQHNADRFTSAGGLGHLRRAVGSRVLGGVTLGVRQDRFETTNLLDGRHSAAAQRWSLTPGAYADLRLWGERLTVSPVAQALVLDNRSLRAAASSDTAVSPASSADLFAPTPRVGLLLRPWTALALKANVSRSVRAPDFTELFGDRGALVGNPDLRPERGVQWDVAARVALPDDAPVGLVVELGHYWNAVDDLIVMVQNAQRTSVPVNLDEAWIQGVEAAATLDLGWLETQSNLTRNTSVNLSTQQQFAGNQLPRIPAWEVHQRTTLGGGSALRVGHIWSYTDGNYWDRTNFYRAAPRSFHNLFARLEPARPWPAVELDVLNLTDRIAEVVPRNPLDPDDPARVVQPTTDFIGYPLPGRTVLLTLRWEQGRPSGGGQP